VTAGGALAAGEHTSHTLDLTPGAQNDVYVTPHDSAQTGATYRVYVTSAACTAYSPDAPKWELPSRHTGPGTYPVRPQDPCAIISSDTLKQQRTMVAGRAKFGAGAHVRVFAHEVSDAKQFKLWVISDSRLPISYDVTVAWTSGHDC
jgi:hypothetical protein